MIISRERAELINPENVYQYLRKVLRKKDKLEREKEHFFLLVLDVQNKVKCIDLLTIGILNVSLIHPREVFRRAIMEGAYSIIIAHNHPSGSSKPSEQDIELTRKIAEAGKIIGIQLIDHVIIADRYTSFKEDGLM